MDNSKPICPLCGGSGWMMTDTKFTQYGIQYDNLVQECACRSGRSKVIVASNVKADIFYGKSFKTFKAETDEQKEMFKKAKVFVAEYEPGNSFGLFGKSGTGKSHLCIAACRQLVEENNLNMKYFDYRKEIQRLRALYFKAEEYQAEIEMWIDTDILYIDDLFKFAKKNGELIEGEAQVMYSIINSRYLEHKTTIFSSEMSVGEIADLDEALGSRIYEMIGRNGYKAYGENYRTSQERMAV